MGRRPELKSDEFLFRPQWLSKYRIVNTHSQLEKCYSLSEHQSGGTPSAARREVWVLLAEVTSALDETTAALLRRLATYSPPAPPLKACPTARRTGAPGPRRATSSHTTRAPCPSRSPLRLAKPSPRMPALSKAVWPTPPPRNRSATWVNPNRATVTCGSVRAARPVCT